MRDRSLDQENNNMPPTAEEVHRHVARQAVMCLQASLERITHCLDQLTTEQIWWRPAPAMNSIGNLLLHLTGNVRQWLVAGIEGSGDTRNRPQEFAERGPIPADALLRRLRDVVQQAELSLSHSSAEAMLAERRIQGMPTTGWGAVFDSVPHFQGHAQEIIALTRLQLGDQYRFRWQPQSVEQGAP
jgi:hypothetical protein